jgi:hypothetical protein
VAIFVGILTFYALDRKVEKTQGYLRNVVVPADADPSASMHA